jgi:hypothetical protein
MQKYTKEQFWKLYEKLPEELQGAVFSVETADNIWNVCENNNIDEVSEIAKLVGNVLLGVLAPEDFQATLEKELKLEKETAKKTTQEINRFIFYPVRVELEKLYQMKSSPTTEAITPTPIKEEPSFAKATEGKEKSTRPKKEDTYREPVE